MRMPRVRLTVRGIMAAVAIASLPLAAGTRARHLRAVAARHQAESSACLERAGGPPTGLCGIGLWGRLTDEQIERGVAATFRERGPRTYRAYLASRHHDALAKKYERAARRPWIPVDPDPPEPE